MIHFHSLQVKEVKKETEDAVSITFSIPPELKETFGFVQGQYLTIRKLRREEQRRIIFAVSAGWGFK